MAFLVDGSAIPNDTRIGIFFIIIFYYFFYNERGGSPSHYQYQSTKQNFKVLFDSLFAFRGKRNSELSFNEQTSELVKF